MDAHVVITDKVIIKEENISEENVTDKMEAEVIAVVEAEIKQVLEKAGQDDDVRNGDDEKKWPGWPGESVFRILVPAQKVGGIIGRKGESIKRMCEESRSRIKILDGPHTVAHTAPERAVMISAKEEPDAPISPAMDGLLRVHMFVADGSVGENPNAPNTGARVTTRLLAPSSQARSLIGRHGSIIKSIQEESDTHIRVLEDVPSFALPEDKIIEIQGEFSGVHKAVELIAGQLRRFLVDRGVIPLFESSVLLPKQHMEQHMMPPPPQPWGPPPGPPPNPSGSFSSSSFIPPPHQHDSFYPPHEVPPMEKPHHSMPSYGREPLSMGSHSANQPQPVVSQITQHMQIPLSYADAVIGTSGASISYIRRASGATITIQETRGVPGEMTVEINGSASQVQTAQQLIHNFMAEASGPPNPSSHVDQGHSYQNHSSNMYSSGPGGAGPGAAGTAGGGGYGSVYGSSYGY